MPEAAAPQDVLITGRRKPTPLEAFEANMEDAELLVALAEAFTNIRARRMRRELRHRLGDALKLPKRQWDQLDCVESGDVFVVLKPGGRFTRGDFANRAPMLRQALVAGCAATETFVADRVIAEVRELIRTGAELPTRLLAIPMDVGTWQAVESYKYRRRGITEQAIAPFLREHVSTAPSKIGEVLAIAGVDKPLRKLDAARHRLSGTTEADLARITDRRNRIAHEGDRRGYGRATIDVDEVRNDLAALREIVQAIDAVLT